MTFAPELASTLGDGGHALFVQLKNQLDAKRLKNNVRTAYYEQKNILKNIDRTLPPHVRSMDIALGWVRTGVDSLSDRLQLSGLAMPEGRPSDYGLDLLVDSNEVEEQAAHANISTLIHGCSFLLTYAGNPALGEPKAVVKVVDATKGTGILSHVPGAGLTAFLGAMSASSTGEVDYYLLISPRSVAHIVKRGAAWEAFVSPHGLGRVPVEVLRYNASPLSPMGRSRITRAAMSTTDAALRTLIRNEVGQELFSQPQRYLMGAPPEAFKDANGNPLPAWKILAGAVWTAPALYEQDEDSDAVKPKMLPQAGQFPQVSPEPFLAQIRQHAAVMAAEMSLPLSSLGVTNDNPSSAEAIYEAQRDLIILAERTSRSFSRAWARALQTAWRIENQSPVLPPELQRLQVVYRDPSTPSRAAAADAAVKLLPVIESGDEVLMELAGMTPAQIERVIARNDARQSRQTMQELLAMTDDETSAEAS